MAASGLVGYAEPTAAKFEFAMNHKVPRVQLVKLKDIFHPTFEKNFVRNRSDIAKCLERLNNARKTITEPYGKAALSRNFTGLFGKDGFSNRLERSPSSDSIGVSNFSSSDQGSDSCNYSSHGSDSNSGSAPCSPEEPDRCCSGEESPNLFTASSYCEPTSTAGCASSIEQQFNLFCSDGKDRISDSTKVFCSSDSKDDLSMSGSQELLCPEDSTDLRTSECFQEGKGSVWTSTSQNELLSDDGKRTSDSQIPLYLRNRNCSVPNSDCDSSTFQTSCVPHSVINSTSDAKSVPDTGASVKQAKSSSKSVQNCMWLQCQCCLDGNAELVEHIKSQHVLTQKEKETFICLWTGCKVYNRPSCSLSWLERHILRHTGIKPFKCIVDKCRQRFNTQAALQRHVNRHFDSSNQNGKTGKCREDAKSLKRRKYLKYKKRSAIVGKKEDFIDPCTMEQIRYNLVEIHSKSPFGTSSCGGMVTFRSKVKAIKKDSCGEVQVLVQWIPENILPDCWLLQKNVPKTKQVSYASLSKASLHQLSHEDDTPRIKQRRK